MKILPYSEDNLAVALSNKYTPVEILSNKNHFRYFKGYLGNNGLKAKTIVLEEDYVSKDYLDDFAAYYVFCFEPYPKICKRIHFFANDFDEEEFKVVILNDKVNQDVFWKQYLGFIVVKPIPTTIIGYTVLKTYETAQGLSDRFFWGIRAYTVHLFGREITVTSLAFQEQDSVLAACATTAIWSMLNKAASDFHTILKSPSQITKDADNLSHDGSRLFPNKGLNLLQICQAIFNSGLVSEVKRPDYPYENQVGDFKIKAISNLYLKKVLTAYSSIGIPIILIVYVPNGNSYGLHAMTICGYAQSERKNITSENEVCWGAGDIEKFYAHDDQFGPFARITFKNKCEIITPWTGIDKENRSGFATNIVVPLYPKIRISFEEIEVLVLGLNRLLRIFFVDKTVGNLTWDIRIKFSENFKRELKTSTLDREVILSYLNKSMPKYLWIASCSINQHIVFECTFDATDVKSGMIGKDVIWYLSQEIREEFSKFLRQNKVKLQTLFSHRASINYYEFLCSKI